MTPRSWPSNRRPREAVRYGRPLHGPVTAGAWQVRDRREGDDFDRSVTDLESCDGAARDPVGDEVGFGRGNRFVARKCAQCVDGDATVRHHDDDPSTAAFQFGDRCDESFRCLD